MAVILGIDTTDRLSLAALVEDGRVLFETGAEELPTAEALFGVLEDVRRACPGKTITHIAVALGPGSYTGIRSGLAAAQGLTLALGAPVIGVSILLARALGAAKSGLVIPWIRANKNEVFAAVYEVAPGSDAGRAAVVRCAQAVSPETLQEWKAEFPGAALACVDLPADGVASASASLVAHAAALRVEGGIDWQQSADGMNLQPLYAKAVRASTLAERKAQQASKRHCEPVAQG